MDSGAYQNLSGLSHGVAIDDSPRREPWARANKQRAAERRKNAEMEVFLSPLPGLAHFPSCIPRLTPWAVFWRCSAAIRAFLLLSNFEMRLPEKPPRGNFHCTFLSA